VQRVAQDLSKSRNGDTVQAIRIERLDVYGKMSPTEQIRRTQTEKETGPGKKSFTSKPN